MAFQGNLERLHDGQLEGWLWNPDSPAPVTLEFRIDGAPAGRALADVYRDDLAAAKVGSGAHAFSWTPPLWCHDGQPHRYEAVAGQGEWAVPGVVTATLPQARHALAIGADGRLAGYVLNPVDPEQALEVCLTVDGETLAGRLASEPVRPGVFDDAPDVACGFAFTLPALSNGLRRSKVAIWVPALRQTIQLRAEDCTRGFRLRVVEADEKSLVVRLSTPLRATGDMVEFYIGGEYAGQAPLRSSQRGSAASVRLWPDAPADLGEDLEVSARVVGLEGLALSIRVTVRDAGLFSSDPRFEHWAGDRLSVWDANAKAVSRAPASPEDERRPELTLRLSPAGDGAGVSQRFSLPEAEPMLDVTLVGRVQTPGRVRVALSGGAEADDSWSVSRTLSLWNTWSERVARFRLPAQAVPDEPVVLNLEVIDGCGEWLDLAAFGCGPAGARVAEAASWLEDGGPPRRWNAVLGEDLAGWAPPLEKRLNRGATALAPGWGVYADAAEEELTARLHGVEPPPGDPEGGQAYGVRLTAAALTSFIRLEVALDRRALAVEDAEQLRFIAQAASQGSAPIRRVFVLQRSRDLDDLDRYEDAIVAALLGPVDLTSDGPQEVSASVPVSARRAMKAAARACQADPTQELLLTFELEGEGRLDLAMTKVRLGAGFDATPDPGSTHGLVAFEDPNIEAQINSTGGLHAWASPGGFAAGEAGA